MLGWLGVLAEEEAGDGVVGRHDYPVTAPGGLDAEVGDVPQRGEHPPSRGWGTFEPGGDNFRGGAGLDSPQWWRFFGGLPSDVGEGLQGYSPHPRIHETL